MNDIQTGGVAIESVLRHQVSLLLLEVVEGRGGLYDTNRNSVLWIQPQPRHVIENILIYCRVFRIHRVGSLEVALYEHCRQTDGQMRVRSSAGGWCASGDGSRGCDSHSYGLRSCSQPMCIHLWQATSRNAYRLSGTTCSMCLIRSSHSGAQRQK